MNARTNMNVRSPVTAETRLNIGLSFFVTDRNVSIWSNGATQNCIFLYELFKRSPRVGKVFLINGGDAERLQPGLMLDDLGLEFHRMEQVIDELDVIVEMGAQLESAHIAYVRQRGGRAIAIKVGNDYVMDIERLIFDRKSGGIFNGAQFDEVWTLPHHANTCRSYFEVCYRAPCRVVPYLWDPMFLEKTIRELPPDIRFGYQPRVGAKRVAIFEPNINVVKTSVYPMLVTELAYRAKPELISEVYVTNAEHLKPHVTFLHFCNALDIVRNKIASFESRFSTPYFLGKYADMVVAHQWENGLNNLYFDALYGGYPLVHNSPFLGDVGYRYEGFDAASGAQALLTALLSHDHHLDAYRARADRALAAVALDNPINLAAYVDPLFELFGV